MISLNAALKSAWHLWHIKEASGLHREFSLVCEPIFHTISNKFILIHTHMHAHAHAHTPTRYTCLTSTINTKNLTADVEIRSRKHCFPPLWPSATYILTDGPFSHGSAQKRPKCAQRQSACMLNSQSWRTDQRRPATETYRQSGERPADVTPDSLTGGCWWMAALSKLFRIIWWHQQK